MKKLPTVLLSMLFSVTCLSCEKMDEIPEEGAVIMIPYLTFEGWEKRQGGAIYNDMLVCLNATDKGGKPNGFVYDIKTGTKLCDMTFTSSLEGKTYAMPHANQVSFGTEFYDETSDFPLLYVSQVNGGNGFNDLHGERGVLVYNLEKIDEKKYKPVLLQAIIPEVTDTELMMKIGNYTPNYIIDTDKGQLVVIGYPNSSWYNLSGPQPITLFKLPSISAGQEIVLANEDVIESYSLPISHIIQQSFYFGGRIYTACGFRNQAALQIINLSSRCVESYYEISNQTSEEPQFLGLWGNKVLYYEYNTSGIIYELVIPKYTFVNNETVSTIGKPHKKSKGALERYNLQGLTTKKTKKDFQIIVESKGTSGIKKIIK